LKNCADVREVEHACHSDIDFDLDRHSDSDSDPDHDRDRDPFIVSKSNRITATTLSLLCQKME